MLKLEDKGITFFIDAEDYDLIKNHSWNLNSSGYLIRHVMLRMSKSLNLQTRLSAEKTLNILNSINKT